MERGALYDRLARQLEALQKLEGTDPFGKEYNAWNANTKSLIQDLFGPGSLELHDFCAAGFSVSGNGVSPQEKYRQTLREKRDLLELLLARKSA